MNLNAEVNRLALTNSGKPSITFKCTDCNRVFLDLEAYLYQANLSANPRTHIEKACEEFITKLGADGDSLFNKSKTLKKLKQSICNCVKGVENIKHQRSINRAKQLGKIGSLTLEDNPVMNLARLLAQQIELLNLHILLPELDWSFGSDNAESIVMAFAQLETNTPVFIRQFTNIESREPFASGEGFIPLKRFAALLLVVENGFDIIPLSKGDFQDCYCTDSVTGAKLPKPKDLKFIDGKEMIKILSQSAPISGG
jgi:hypothetical protein